MTAELTRTGPLDAWSARFAALPAGLDLRAEPWHAQTTVRLAPAPAALSPAAPSAAPDPDPAAPTTAALAELVGEPLPGPNTWAGDRITAIRLGPDECLLTSADLAPAELEAAARATGATAVDTSAQRTTLRLAGTHARAVLETGCAIDLHPRAFGAGSAAVTLLGRAGVVLLGLPGPAYRLLVRTSFAGYLADWLLDAAVEYTDAGDAAAEQTGPTA